MDAEELQRWFSEKIIEQDAVYQKCCENENAEDTVPLRQSLWKGTWQEKIDTVFQNMQKTLDEEKNKELFLRLQKLRLEYMQVDWKIRKDMIEQELRLLEAHPDPYAENDKKLNEMLEAYEKTGYPDQMEVLQKIETARSKLQRQLKEQLFPVEKMEITRENIELVNQALKVFASDQEMTRLLQNQKAKMEEKRAEIDAYQQMVLKKQLELKRQHEEEAYRETMDQISRYLNCGNAEKALSVWKTGELNAFMTPEAYAWNNFFIHTGKFFQKSVCSLSSEQKIADIQEIVELKYQYRFECIEKGMLCYEQKLNDTLDLLEKLLLLERKRKIKNDSSKVDNGIFTDADGRMESFGRIFQKTKKNVQKLFKNYEREGGAGDSFYYYTLYEFEEKTGLFKIKEKK